MKFYLLALATGLVVCVGCQTFEGVQSRIPKDTYTAPPAGMMQQGSGMGIGGPGPGVMQMPGMQGMPPGMQGMRGMPPMQGMQGRPMQMISKTTQVRFLGPEGMQIGWQIPNGYAENQVMAPGRHNFRQGGTYRLKLTDIPGHKALTLYPSLQLYPSDPTTNAYLSHNSVPIELTVEDFEQIESNNYVTKVIYLPAAKYQELAIAGVETLVSTRLDPGVDPVKEASRRGTIMAVIRVGNMDLEMPGNQPGNDGVSLNGQGGVKQVVHIDGEKDQFIEPMLISLEQSGLPAIPGAMIVATGGLPGQPVSHPIAGMGGTPTWGMPTTATPIGLPGPPHLPYGGQASLKSHTIRNNTPVDMGKPVKDFVIDVNHSPGYRMPHPVKYVKYSERHPVYKAGETEYPAYTMPRRN